MEGCGFADVVQERSPGEGHGAAWFELVEKQQGVGPDVAFGVELRRLIDAFELCGFRQDLGEKAGGVE